MSTDSEEAGYYAMSDASSSESCPDDEGDAFAIQVGMAGGARPRQPRRRPLLIL